MRKNLLFALLFSAAMMQAQQNNSLLEQGFWKKSPTIEDVKTEIDKGNDPSESNSMHMDVATLAIKNNASTEVIRFLLDQKGIDINKPTHEKRAYLHWATMRGNTEVIGYLIKKGADINLEDEHAFSPLYLAINSGMCKPEIIDMFFKAGLDPQKKYKDGANMLLISVPYDKDMKLTDYLIGKGLSLKSTDNNGATAFDYAARKGNVGMMKALLNKGVKYTGQALMMAALGTRREGNTVEVYRYLIDELKVKPSLKDKDGNTLLNLIVRKQNQAEVAAYLISKGVDVNPVNNEGNNALMLASGGRDIDLVKNILAKTRNINAVNLNGESALTQAVGKGASEIVALLLENKGDVNVVDKKGFNLAYYLMQSYRTSGGSGGMRGDFGGVNNAPAKDEFGEKMKLLKSYGLNLITLQKDGSTLMHYAVTKGDVDLVRKIAGMGVDINAQNNDGLTALHKAAITALDDQILKYMISIGAKKDLKSAFDETAYDFLKNNENLKRKNIDVSFLK